MKDEKTEEKGTHEVYSGMLSDWDKSVNQLNVLFVAWLEHLGRSSLGAADEDIQLSKPTSSSGGAGKKSSK